MDLPEHHPLLKELLQKCSTQNINCGRAYVTFEVFLALLQDERLIDLNYSFDESLKMFYLLGTRKNDEFVEKEVYIPISFNDEITFTEINLIQEKYSPQSKSVQFVIVDEDSSLSCYNISKGLVKPDSSSVCKTKKDIEEKNYQLLKNVRSNKKILHSKALKAKSK